MRIWFFVVIISLSGAFAIAAFEMAEFKTTHCPATHRVCI